MNPSALLAVLVAVCVGAQAAAPVRGPAQVIDGDSLVVAGQQIRLWGIDAPEFKQTCTRKARRWRCGSAAARQLREYIDGRPVACAVLDTDTYGRAVSKCTVDGRSVNEWLVREGWALDYGRYSAGEFAAAQNQASAARRGIWAGTFDPPEQWRRRNRR